MAPRPNIRQRTTPNGRWKPPKALGYNLKLAPQGQLTPTYYHDGETTGLRDIPDDAEEYQVYSIYYEQATFWTVKYDATRKQVEDGDDADRRRSSDSTDDDELDDWWPLSFGLPEGSQTYLSYAGRRQTHRRLIVQRPDQLWAEQLLSDTYQAPHGHRTNDRRFGGLVGDISLLIGIAAMSLPPAQVRAVLPFMIVNPPEGGSWRVLPQASMPRGAGCTLVPLDCLSLMHTY